MKHLFRLLLVLLIATASLVCLTGCEKPPATNPEPPPAARQPAAAPKETAVTAKTTDTAKTSAPAKTVDTAKASVPEKNVATAPAFSLNDLYTGKAMQIPADIKGSKTALVFFSLT